MPNFTNSKSIQLSDTGAQEKKVSLLWSQYSKRERACTHTHTHLFKHC